MYRRRFLVLVVVVLVVIGAATVSADDWPDEEPPLNEEAVVKRDEGESVASVGRRWVEVPRCKQRNETCSGFPRCCDKLHCFWEGGINPFKSGVCVPCIDRNQKCQRDAQCCESLACHKASRFQVDGVCEAKRPVGEECHDDDQCQSNYCLMTWLEVIKGQGGRCTPML